jgi:hypothetical protein
MKALSPLTEKPTALQNDLSSISSGITGAAHSLTTAGAAVDESLGKVLGGITESTRIAEETNRSIRTSQEAISGAVESLRNAMTVHIQRFDQVDERLAGIFSSIASHLEEQSR